MLKYYQFSRPQKGRGRSLVFGGRNLIYTQKKFFEIHDQLAWILNNVSPMERIRGGFFMVANPVNGVALFTTITGEIHSNKVAALSGAVAEEAAQLAANPGQDTSFLCLTGNPQKEVASAIRTRGFIFSLAGGPRETCEAILFCLACRLDQITLKEAQGLALLTSNQQFARIWKAVPTEIQEPLFA